MFRFKKITDRGTGKFTLRQLSARLTSDSVMIGVLSLFLSVTFIAINLSYAQKSVIAYENEATFPYDFTIAFRQKESELNPNPFTEEDLDDLLQLVSSYATIKQSHFFHVYTPAHPRDYDPEGFENGLYDSYTIPVGNYYRESDYLTFCEMLGYDAPRLNGGYLICNPTDYQTKKFSFSAETTSSPITLDRKSYVCIGTLDAPRYLTNGEIWNETFIVVPDEAITARELEVDSTWGGYLRQSEF